MKLPRAISACLTSAVHITPELMISPSDERSYGAPSASASSSARTIGLPNASPTIAICVTLLALRPLATARAASKLPATRA